MKSADLRGLVIVRGEVRSAAFERVSHGVFLRRGSFEGEDRFRRELAAWLLVLPDDVVFTHVTAARLRGWQLPKLPAQTPVFAAVRGDRRPRRPGLICSRLVHESAASEAAGLPVDTPEEVLLRAARDLSLLDLLIMLDSAALLGDLDAARMATILSSGRPGVALLRAAYALCDPLCESAGETLLRLFHMAVDVPTRSQVPLHRADGGFVARADLLVTGTTWVHEYDGAHHRSGRQHALDLRRERALHGIGYKRKGFVLDDLLNRDHLVMHELDRDLDRTHHPSRLRRWRRLVGDSLYADRGRDRVLNRWKRATVLVDWARIAAPPA